jgi:hypothetical protein
LDDSSSLRASSSSSFSALKRSPKVGALSLSSLPPLSGVSSSTLRTDAALLPFDKPLGDSARARFGVGAAKLWTPCAYDEKALELVELGKRGGDLARPSFDDDPSTGDFALAALAKGGEDEINMSNAERFTGAVDGAEGRLWPGMANGDTDLAGVDGAIASGLLCEEGRLPKEDLEENTLLPLTDAKGELVEA